MDVIDEMHWTHRYCCASIADNFESCERLSTLFGFSKKLQDSQFSTQEVCEGLSRTLITYGTAKHCMQGVGEDLITLQMLAEVKGRCGGKRVNGTAL